MFDQFWRLYPTRNGRKLGKAICMKCFCSLSKDEQLLVLKATEQYAKFLTQKQTAFVPSARDPIRFLKASWWRDWLPVEAPVQPRLPVAPPKPVEYVSMHEALKDKPEQLATLERMLSHGPSLSLAPLGAKPSR